MLISDFFEEEKGLIIWPVKIDTIFYRTNQKQ
jgi:hypothetical protein